MSSETRPTPNDAGARAERCASSAQKRAHPAANGGRPGPRPRVRVATHGRYTTARCHTPRRPPPARARVATHGRHPTARCPHPAPSPPPRAATPPTRGERPLTGDDRLAAGGHAAPRLKLFGAVVADGKLAVRRDD